MGGVHKRRAVRDSRLPHKGVGEALAGRGTLEGYKDANMRNERQRNADSANLRRAIDIRLSRRVSVICLNCGESNAYPVSVATRHGGKKFCSWACRAKYMRGEHAPNSNGGAWMRGPGNPRWKGAKPDERRARHNTDEIQQWRRRVFARDWYTCQSCGLQPKIKNQLRSHHIKPWAEYPDLRLAISNGITLCKKCHDGIHYPKG